MRAPTLITALEHHADRSPGQEFGRWCLGRTETIVTFGELRTAAARYGAFLRAHGVRPGEVVLIVLPSGPELWFAFLGALRIGAVPSFMPGPSAKQDAHHHWTSHAHLFARIGAGALLTATAHVDAIHTHLPTIPQRVLDVTRLAATPSNPANRQSDRALALPLAPAFVATASDIALLQHSSGTTGLKKGVALSHQAILRQLTSYTARLEISPHDRIVSWLPLYHDMGLICCFLLPLVTGVPVVMLDPFEWVANPVHLFATIARLQPTLCWQPNFAFHHLSRTVRPTVSHDLSSVRAWINCSEPCRPETFDLFVRRFRTLGVTADRLQVCYAMAETVFAVTQTTAGSPPRELSVDPESLRDTRFARPVDDAAPAIRFVSAGRVLDGLTVRILDADHHEVPPGRVGEITLAGACLFDGYFLLPEETARKLRDGWYHTGDLGFIHDGELYVTGRQNDLIIVHGRNYYAHELEFLLNQIPDLHPGRNVVLGLFRPEIGSEDLVVIAERSAAASASRTSDHADLVDTIKHTLLNGAGVLPYDVAIVPPGWLRKTTSGKIARRANLENYLHRASAILADRAA